MADFKSVLIVDDEPSVGKYLADVINSRGGNFLITCESEPLKALKLFNIYLPDILITDYQMPGANGIELAVRAKNKNKSIPVLIVTGTMDIPEDELRLIKDLNIQIIHKPFSPEEIYRWLDYVAYRPNASVAPNIRH